MDPALHLTLRVCLALLLATAAFHKLGDPPRFRETLRGYELLPEALVPALAVLVTAAEAVLALLLFGGIAVAAAGLAAALLLFTYAAAIQVNLHRGRTDIDCGCMGPAARVPLGGALVVRNLVLALAAASLAVTPSLRSLTVLDLAAVLAATAALAACYLATERMLALAPRVAALRRKTA